MNSTTQTLEQIASSLAERYHVKLGHIHRTNADPFEMMEEIQRLVPASVGVARSHWSTVIPDGAVRIGSVRVHPHDPDSTLYVYRRWLSLQQAADQLGVNKRTVWRHLDRLDDDEKRQTGAGYWQVRGDMLEKLR